MIPLKKLLFLQQNKKQQLAGPGPRPRSPRARGSVGPIGAQCAFLGPMGPRCAHIFPLYSFKHPSYIPYISLMCPLAIQLQYKYCLPYIPLYIPFRQNVKLSSPGICSYVVLGIVLRVTETAAGLGEFLGAQLRTRSADEKANACPGARDIGIL